MTPVIQWHVVGMFAPSFFTGSLIKRYGAPRIMQIGFVLLLGNVVLALSGVEFLHFLSALVLLGVGWNFAFIGGTTLLTQTYRPAEQLKVQAVNEFAVFGLVAVATLSAGWLYDRFGWVTLNLAVVPLLLAALDCGHRHRAAVSPAGGGAENRNNRASPMNHCPDLPRLQRHHPGRSARAGSHAAVSRRSTTATRPPIMCLASARRPRWRPRVPKWRR